MKQYLVDEDFLRELMETYIIDCLKFTEQKVPEPKNWDTELVQGTLMTFNQLVDYHINNSHWIHEEDK